MLEREKDRPSRLRRTSDGKIGDRMPAAIAGTGKLVVLSWVRDWSWGLPFLVLTIIAHVSAILWTAKMLVTYRRKAAKEASHFVIFVAFAALASAVYLAIEAAAWAVLYLWLGALPAWAPAMLYSLEAITSFGHAQIYLEDHWQLLGAIEAVNASSSLASRRRFSSPQSSRYGNSGGTEGRWSRFTSFGTSPRGL